MFFKKKRANVASTNNQRQKVISPVDEHILQYTDPGKSGECELVIGLDFGTSASKVVIQAPDLPGQPSFAVNFGQLSHNTRPYLLPTKLWVNSSGTCSLTYKEDARLVKDIKIRLFAKDEESGSQNSTVQQSWSPEEIATVYLGLLLRLSRKWFLEEKRDFVRDFKILRWSMNLGVPSPCIEDNEENRVFRRVGKAAWLLSTLNEEQMTLSKAAKELSLVEDPHYWEPENDFSCDFEIIPEIAAGAVGYALSSIRRDGLHVIVDVGASTVDVCLFNLKESEGSNSYSLLMADVKLLGTNKLHNNRIVGLKYSLEKQIEAIQHAHDPLIPIKDEIDSLVISREELIHSIDQENDKHKKELLIMMRKIINQTQYRRDRKALVWKKGRLPIILIGGGSKLPFFRSAVEELDGWLKHLVGNDGINLLPATVPKSLTHSGSIDDNLFLAVTWGLSHRAIDVGDIIPADSIPDDDPPPRLDVHSRYVGKELT